MTTPITADAKDLIALAERMAIPVGEAARQVERLIDVAPGLARWRRTTVENANVLRTVCAGEVTPNSRASKGRDFLFGTSAYRQ